MSSVQSPLSGIVVAIAVQPGDSVAVGTELLTIESMKMHIPVESERAGTVTQVLAKPGQEVAEGDVLVVLE